jgi:DNA-binding GntR family transcriptional regulator
LPGSEVLVSKSLRELVYEHLRQAIQSGELKPGSFLDQKKMASELGISRQPLRDALIQLELEGFVDVIPRRGVEVRKLSLDDIRHLYGLIGALERHALRHAKLGDADVREMRRLNGAMTRAIRADDFDAYYDLNLAFHDVFLAQSDNPGLLRSVRIAKQRLYDFPRERRFHREWELASIREHERVIELVGTDRYGEAGDFLEDVHWSFRVQYPFLAAYYHMDGSAVPAPDADGSAVEGD